MRENNNETMVRHISFKRETYPHFDFKVPFENFSTDRKRSEEKWGKKLLFPPLKPCKAPDQIE